MYLGPKSELALQDCLTGQVQSHGEIFVRESLSDYERFKALLLSNKPFI